MPHSFVSALFHCVWSTKERRPVISSEMQERLWPFIGGIARENGFKTLAVGGVEDHMHALISLPSTMSISKAIQLMKGGSSKWMNDTFFAVNRAFSWQEGYGAFSIGVSQVDATVNYIGRQAEHHRRRTFQEELLAILKKHQIEYDPRYIWD